MTTITPEAIKELRDKTSAGIMDCKQALADSDGDVDKAVDFLRKKGIATASKKSSRATNEGIISSYIHMGGKIGVLVEINCETDFVARLDEFQNFVKDVSMQVAAAAPIYVSSDEVAEDFIEKEKEVIKAQLEEKPPEILDKIVQGKIDKRFKEICLLDQGFIKDDSQTIGQLLTALIAKTGENIVIRRFVRFELGSDS